MYHIIQKISLNLPRLMMYEIREAAAKNKVCLSYGMALTRVFETVGISLENEGFKNSSHFVIYDEKALTCMHFHVEVRRWVRNESGQERREPRI